MELLRKTFLIILDIKNASRARKVVVVFFQNSKIDKITNFNVSVAVKPHRDNNGGNENWEKVN